MAAEERFGNQGVINLECITQKNRAQWPGLV